MTALAPAPRAAATAASVAERAPKQRLSPERIAAGLTLVALVVASLFALNSLGISLPAMLESWSNAERFFTRVGTIRFPEPLELVQLTALTLGIVVTGTLFAAICSVPIAYLAASNTTPGRAWRAAARFITVFTRALPDVVLAMVFVLLFSLGSLPGILAIGIHSIGMISKLFADAIEQIDEGPRRAIRAAGGSKLQEFTSGILPQVLPSWVATVLHRNDINLRGSVVLGYVGVAGLGLEMSHAFKSLNYSLGLGVAIVMFALCVLMEIISSAVRRAMLHGGRSDGGPLPATTVEAAARRPWTGSRVRTTVWGWVTAALLIGAIAVCNIQWGDLVTVWAKIPPVAAQFWPPSFGAYDWTRMSGAMLETIAIALAAAVLTLLASIVIGSFAARNVAPNPGTRAGARFLLVGIRGVPEVILAIVLIVITGLGAQAGTLALAFGGIGLAGKLIADSLEEVKGGPERAITATGASRFQRYAAATLPQGAPAIIGHSFYLLDTNIRAATILGIVGGGGIGYYLLNAGQGSNYGVVTAIVLMILVTVLAVEGLAMWMRRVFR